MFDIAIIGSGPAGLSAAITAKVRNKEIILFGQSNLSDKVEKAHSVENYLGLPSVSGESLGHAFRAHTAAMGIEITEDRIKTVYAMGEFFALQGASGEMYQAKTVILAAGVAAAKPLPGETELLGSGVSYCATCDAPLYRGKTVAVLGYSPKEEKEAAFLSEVCEKVLYFPVYKETPDLPEAVEVVEEIPLEITAPDMRTRAVKTAANEYAVDGVFVLRESVAPAQLVPGLETDGSRVLCDREMKTNLPGVFVCGDITGRPYQYIKAAGEGNVAALSAVDHLAEKQNNNEEKEEE